MRYRDDYAAAGVPMLPVVAPPLPVARRSARLQLGHGRGVAAAGLAARRRPARCTASRARRARRGVPAREPPVGAARPAPTTRARRCGCSTGRSPTSRCCSSPWPSTSSSDRPWPPASGSPPAPPGPTLDEDGPLLLARPARRRARPRRRRLGRPCRRLARLRPRPRAQRLGLPAAPRGLPALDRLAAGARSTRPTSWPGTPTRPTSTTCAGAGRADGAHGASSRRASRSPRPASSTWSSRRSAAARPTPAASPPGPRRTAPPSWHGCTRRAAPRWSSPTCTGSSAHGETSLLFLGGRFSHARRREPLLAAAGARDAVVVDDVLQTVRPASRRRSSGRWRRRRSTRCPAGATGWPTPGSTWCPAPTGPCCSSSS